jgi:hypothetical protein
MDTRDKEQETMILQISEGGSKIGLKDGSKWKIAPYFKKEVFDYWRHGDKVTIREVSDDPAYPWTIFKTDGKSEVTAKRIN